MTTAARSIPVKSRDEDATQENQLAVIARRFWRHTLAVISLALILMIFVASLLAPFITTFPRDAIDIAAPSRPAPPGALGSGGRVHILGVDHLGRDLFTRVLY